MTLHQADPSLFWYFINERHRIYTRRTAGDPKPWTQDPILQSYKFTNVFRQLDTGTVWLTEHFIQPHWHDDPALMLFNIGWYRQFNWIGTGERLGWRKSWRPTTVTRILTKAKEDGEQVFTGAHIVWGEFGLTKIEGVVKACTALWKVKREIASYAKFSNSLEYVHNELVKIRGIGGFIAYEIVSDLRHTPLLNRARDINSWANVGPGAMRGLRRLFPSITPSSALDVMILNLLLASKTERADWVPPLELRDIEHSLCEFDKYCRVKFGEGRPRSTYDGGGNGSGR